MKSFAGSKTSCCVYAAIIAAGLAAPAAQASFVVQFEANNKGAITSFTGRSGVINQSKVTVGTFQISIYDVQSNSGTSRTPQISTVSVSIAKKGSSKKTDILAINLWDTGFLPIGSPLTLAGSGSVTFNAATSGDSATFASGADPLDGTYSLTTPSPPVQTGSSTATYSSGGFPQTQTLVEQTAVFSPNGTNPFSMGNNLELSLAGGSNVTLSYTTTVPETASLELLAVGGLGLLLKRRRKGQ